jgi:hypothetical protein
MSEHTVVLESESQTANGEEPMNDLTSSAWRTAYVAAILESKDAIMASRISDARAAINERLNSLVQITPHEHEALDAAMQKLATLKVQHVDVTKPTAPTGDTVPI